MSDIKIHNPEKKIQTIEINDIKLDFSDLELAQMAVSSEILNIQEELRNNPELTGANDYNSMLHMLEEKLKLIMEKMEQPAEHPLQSIKTKLPDCQNHN